MDIRVFDKFSEKSVLVIGDIMLDRYVYGQATRISPEAPVPVVKVTYEEDILSGAANVANNLAALGVKTHLAGIVGKDNEAESLKKLLKKHRIDALLSEDSSRPTIVKKRIISGNNYQLLRLDYEVTSDIAGEQEKAVIAEFKKIIAKVDAVIISDYAKGLLTENIAKEVISESKKYKKAVIVDGKPKHIKFFKNCSLITPNLKEAIEMTGIDHDIERMGEALVKLLDCCVFLTRGPEGISVFDAAGKHTHVPPIKINKVFDVTGAGDTVVALSALGLISGFDLVETAILANYAAGIVVQKPGTSTLTVEELKTCMNTK